MTELDPHTVSLVLVTGGNGHDRRLMCAKPSRSGDGGIPGGADYHDLDRHIGIVFPTFNHAGHRMLPTQDVFQHTARFRARDGVEVGRTTGVKSAQ